MTDPLSTIRPGVGRLLCDLDRAPPAELDTVCGAWLRRHLGVGSCALLLADYGETTLESVANGSSDDGSGMGRHDMADSPASLAYRQQRTVRREQPDRDGAGTHWVVYVPVTIRTERLGVLVVALVDQTVTSEVVEILDDVAHVIAYVLTGARRYTDRFEMLRRQRDLSLPAEIQWELLPSLAYELPGFSIAGSLEPAYGIDGDTFDYAVSAHRLTVSITDAVGHGLQAALLGSLAVTAMRNTRRSDAPILAQAMAANQHLAEQFPGSSFVTGLLMQLEVATGIGVIINGRVTQLLTTQAHLPPIEFVRHLTHAVMEFRSGKLADDATAVCLDWHPKHPTYNTATRLA